MSHFRIGEQRDRTISTGYRKPTDLKRSSAAELFDDLERRRNPVSQIPLFISDDWDAFEEALLNIYGKVEQPPYAGVGGKPNPVLVPKEDLLYSQVCKKCEMGALLVW